MRYDHFLRSIPHVPFIVELATLSFKVELPMCRAQQRGDLPYFELIQVPDKSGQFKNIGHRCVDFIAYSSGFKLLGEPKTLSSFLELINEDDTIQEPAIFFEPDGWEAHLKSEFKSLYLSLDKRPATGFSAWEIYSKYVTWQYQRKINEITDDLNNDRIKPEYLKNRLPRIYQHYLQSKRVDNGLDFSLFEQAIVRHALTKTPDIKVNKSSRHFTKQNGEKTKSDEALANLDLLVSYFYALSNNASHKINKAEVMRGTIKLFYPYLAADELEDIAKDICKKARRIYKNAPDIRWLYPNLYQ